MGYKYYNPNPLGLSVGDCTIRAISKIIERDWKQTYLRLVSQGYKMYDMPSANRVLCFTRPSRNGVQGIRRYCEEERN